MQAPKHGHDKTLQEQSLLSFFHESSLISLGTKINKVIRKLKNIYSLQ